MKQTIKCLIAAFAAMLMSVAAFAQVTTSALGGRIVDANGDPVIGAAVVATHEPSGTVYGVITNEDGRYAINGMRSGGPYKVEFSCLGYQPLTYTNVSLQLAETTALNGQLNEDSMMLGEAMVIAASASKFAAEKTGAATNISSSQITSLPTVSRSITDVTRLSPYGGNGMSFAGADGRTGNFTVDGANFNNNFGLNDGLPGGGSPISIDAIEEMQVVISPYDVRQTNFIGGGVNAITKSGTNKFRGTAYVYHQNQDLHGDTVDGTQIDGARAKDMNTTYGFTLGGPIIKNKLFFFVNAEYTKKPSIVNRWRGTSVVDENGNGVGDSDNYISRTTLADLERVSKFVKDKYGYDTGSWTDFPADESNRKILARLDWNINDNHKLALRYNYTLNRRWSAPNGTSMDGGSRLSSYRMSKNSMSYANSMYSQDNLVHSLSLDLNSRLSDNLSNQFLITYSQLNDVRGTTSDMFPFIDIKKDGDNYLSLGYELFTLNNGVHNTIATLKDDLTYYAGNHKVVFGLSAEYQMADNVYMRNGTGYYRYNSVDDFINEAAPEVVALTYGYDGEEQPAARVRFYKAGVYAQDDWNVNDNFKLSYGLRLDGLFFNNADVVTNNAILELDYYDENGNVRHIDTGKWPSASVTVSPRVGFNWDVLGNNALKVRGGSGLFSGRIPLVFFTNMPTNSGSVQYKAAIGPSGDKVDMNNFAGGLVVDKNGNPTIAALRDKLVSLGYPYSYSPEDGVLPSAIAAVDPKFKMPQVWKTSLAVDYSFPTSFPFSITAEGIFNKTVNAVCASDWSLLPPEGFPKFNGVDNRPIFPTGYRQGTKAIVLENTSKGYGWSANVTMRMQPIEGLSLMAAYTHTVSKEVTGMPGSDAESAMYYVPTVSGINRTGLHNSQYVTPDRVVASATHSDKSGNHFSFIYEAWRGGYNYSYMLTNDMNGDTYQYDAIYIPTDEQVANKEFRFVSEDDANRFLAYVHSDKYLSKNQGKYAEAYSVYSPWVHRVDFSYKHDFKVNIGKSVNTLQLCLDIKNVLNMFNSSWGVSKWLNPEVFTTGEARILKYEGMDADGYATFSTVKGIDGNTQRYDYNHALGQCWYASIGIKYLFN